ncbi:hypothetical protein CEXT_133381 [Caerostris extrusa]|uniref:Uncharacterized protein n=1 Tax=Caerostris extrusa TaxID=172846 RepID=A0AAV4NMT2_CAEEX|nr:hypothetical protein CEXT_133381 [Caerostris extrusa]
MAPKSIAVNLRKSPFDLQETNVVYVFVLRKKECDKSRLIRALATDTIVDSNLPSLTVFESRELFSRTLFILRFCELSGEAVRLEEVKRTCQQQNTVLFYCFAIDDIYSLNAMNMQWIAPLRITFGIMLPSILVGICHQVVVLLSSPAIRHLIFEQPILCTFSYWERKKCGKSSLIRTLATNEVEDCNLPSLTVFQSRESISEKVFLLRFCELTKETIHLEEVKQTCQQQNIVLFFCFAIDDVYSLHAINLDWIAPLRINIGIELPSILVGNKIDLRGHPSSSGKGLFKFSCGDKMRKVFDLCLYHECSSVSGKAIPDLSWLAIALTLDPHFVM